MNKNDWNHICFYTKWATICNAVLIAGILMFNYLKGGA